MTGVFWAVIAAAGFGLFQVLNRLAGRRMAAYQATFILLLISTVVLVGASLLTEDLGLLARAPLSAFVSFALAGLIHFFLGWTLLTISQNRVGAALTGALVGATPLFATVIGAMLLAEFLNTLTILGVVLVVAGVYTISSS
jgi:drug/metabolite transporter (DMT)-like permease